MKRNKLYIISVLALAGLIVAPVIEYVNYDKTVNVAEGSPLPAPVPRPPAAKAVTVAEGSPLPAPVPRPPATDAVTVAEGSPLPAPVPRPPVFVA